MRARLGALSQFKYDCLLSFSQFLPAADQIALSTAGTERMCVDASGNVGIGTTSPAVSLDLSAKTDALRMPAGTPPKAGETFFLEYAMAGYEHLPIYKQSYELQIKFTKDQIRIPESLHTRGF